MPIKKTENNNDSGSASELSRREFLYYSAGTFGAMTLSSFAFGGDGAGNGGNKIRQYPISHHVTTTLQEMIAFPKTLPGLTMAGDIPGRTI